MTTYRPSRVPHAILRFLAPGPAFLADLAGGITVTTGEVVGSVRVFGRAA
jgi:hypothetical protein